MLKQWFSWFFVLGRCEVFRISNWHHRTSSEHGDQQEPLYARLLDGLAEAMNKEENWMWCWIDHLTSSEHWEQQESTVSPLDRTGLNIEGWVFIEEEERTSFFKARCGVSEYDGCVDDVDGDHGGGFGDKMISSKTAMTSHGEGCLALRTSCFWEPGWFMRVMPSVPR